MRNTLGSLGASLALALSAAGCVAPQAAGPSPLSSTQPVQVNRFATLVLPDPDLSLPAASDPSLDGLRSTTLSKFTSEAEFMDWLALTRAAANARGIGWISHRANAPVAEAAPMDGAADSAPSEITVTASAISPGDANPEITNNQKQGVDEGDIVKQIGNHLVILQDGRLFVADLMPGGSEGLALAGRADVYRSSDEDTWYDEMLVSGRTILVTGYSYRENASEYTVLTLGEDGGVTREATFYISSDDYYSAENYATRMIDGKLVIHTPIYIGGRGWWDAFDPPVIREWRAESGDGDRVDSRDGAALFRAKDIWMPVQRVLQPVIHTVTVCDIAGASDAAAPACTSTAMVGSENHEFLVTKDAFWLWMTPSSRELERDDGDLDEAAYDAIEAACDTRVPDDWVTAGVLARLPIDGATPGVLGVRGMPQNQFSMDMDDGTFRALLDWTSAECGWNEPDDAPLAFFDTPLMALGPVLADAVAERYTGLPGPGASDYEARFTESHLVYGARMGWGTWPPDEGDEARPDGQAIVVPVADPGKPVRINVPHDVIRAERAGPYMALTGYHDHRGLSVSLIDLRAAPRRAGTMTLIGRFESESRSHAFNSNIGSHGAGLIGLPTIPDSEDADRFWWWSSISDLTYLNVSADGKLGLAGNLVAARNDPDAGHPHGYECEVSCVDWYGNARPIFTGGRLLSLINTELIEGRYVDGRVSEIRRVDLTAKLD